jgi:transposase
MESWGDDEEALMRKRSKRVEQVDVVHPNAAGLDIGSREIWGCVPADRDSQPIRAFGTFTPDLHQLADWLVKCGVDTIAMESTGVYWIPSFEILEARGLKVYLVNAHHIKNVPGRKSDYQDCQWIQKLHSWGLLTGSFRPDEEMCALRAYLRHRAQLIQHRAPHILHMQKSLQQMNIQLSQVLSDITGDTGMAIVRAIVAGERDAIKLAQLRDWKCKAPEATFAKALSGNWKDEHIFVLAQSLQLYDFYTKQVTVCDTQIRQQFTTMKPRWDNSALLADALSQSAARKGKKGSSPDTRMDLVRLTGVDLTAVDGISDSLAQTILSEIGTDMTKWPSDKHFAS